MKTVNRLPKVPRPRQYSDSTLMKWTKRELIDMIRILEDNYEAAMNFNARQCENFTALLDDLRGHDEEGQGGNP